MYEKLTKLSDNTIIDLNDLISQVEFTDKDKRLGAGGPEKISVYTYSKWHQWNRSQRNNFKNMFDPALVQHSVVGWFIKFPANSGFLDLMTAWVNQQMSGVITAYALNENQSIWLNDQEVIVEKGEGIKFSLRIPHEVKIANFERNWACLMQLG